MRNPRRNPLSISTFTKRAVQWQYACLVNNSNFKHQHFETPGRFTSSDKQLHARTVNKSLVDIYPPKCSDGTSVSSRSLEIKATKITKYQARFPTQSRSEISKKPLTKHSNSLKHQLGPSIKQPDLFKDIEPRNQML